MIDYFKLFFCLLIMAYICGIIAAADINFFYWKEGLRQTVAGWTGGLFCVAAIFLTMLKDNKNKAE